MRQMEADVVVVACGMSGLCAATQAQESLFLQSYIMDNHIIRTLHKRRIHVAERYHSLLS